MIYLLATVVVFLGFKKLFSRIHNPVANPLLFSIVFFITLFSFSNISYFDYEQGNKIFIWLLEPAVVALAIPLFTQLKSIRSQLLPIILSCFLGVILAISSCLIIALMFTNEQAILLSLIPKSVTSPIAMAIANETGGLASLAAAVVIGVGLFGALGGFSLLRMAKIHNPQAQGLAIGCSAHAIGTAKALETGEIEGAFSSLALVISGILTAIVAPLFAWFLLWYLS